MKTYNSRIALRISDKEREKIEQLILERKFKNISQVIRTAITEFLNKPEINSKQPEFVEGNPMTQHESKNERAELTRLMQSIAREVAYEVMDEHLEDCEHKLKKPDASELEGEA